jgi:hypothetical protein
MNGWQLCHRETTTETSKVHREPPNMSSLRPLLTALHELRDIPGFERTRLGDLHT